MHRILIGALAALALSATAGAIVIASGVIEVGADVPHSPAVHQVLSFSREQSIARRTAEIKVPDDLDDPERVQRGAGNYDAMCVNCHLAPELPDSEIRQGLYPQPPNLSLNKVDVDAARTFWIIKHGIKASGMPAWSKGGMDDAAIWDLVALLRKMPALSKAAYEQLAAASEGHSHAGMTGHADAAGGPRETQPPPGSKGSSHDHAAHLHDKHPH